MLTRDDLKAERIWKILLCLSTSRGVKVSDLALKFDTTRRTIYRNLMSLSRLGAPIYSDREGWKLLSSFSLLTIGLSLDEAIALHLAASSAPPQKIQPFSSQVNSALSKIDETLTDPVRRDLEEVVEMTSTVPHTGADNSESKKLGIMFDRMEKSIYSKTSIIASYRSVSRDEPIERRLNPYALFFRRHSWYLAAHDHKDERTEIFRLNRFEWVRRTTAGFDMPEDFSLGDFLANSWDVFVGDGEEVEVVVRFSPRVIPLAQERAEGPNRSVERLPDGSAIYRAKVRGAREISFWILGFGDEAEVLEPPELREEMGRIAQKMAGLYGGQTK